MTNPIPLITIDAGGRILGRLATQIALELMGKNDVFFKPNVIARKKILIKNAKGILVTGKKLEQKVYHHHSGYLGGLKTEKLGDLMASNPALALRRAVEGMIPKNRLRTKRMEMLEIHN